MTKNHAPASVASAMIASGSLEYDPTAGISRVDWDQTKQRILEATHHIFGQPPQSSSTYRKEDVLTCVVVCASHGQAPEALARMFEPTKRFDGFRNFGSIQPITGEEKWPIIKAIAGQQLSDPFAPLPIGEGQFMLQNVYGHWFTLARAKHSIEVLLRHARAHHKAADVMFKRRDSLYSFQGWNHDGATTQGRPAALAKLEMEQIIALGLSDERLLNFFVWWTITGEINSSRQLADKYSSHELAATDALLVLEPLIRGPIPHSVDSHVFEFKGVRLYFLQGVCVPAALVMSPAAALDPRTVLTCANPGIRKKLAQKITYARLLTTLGRVVDEVGEYQLWGLSFPDMDIRVLRIEARLEQDTSKAWWEGVVNTCQTVKDALIFRNGTDKLPAWIT